MPTAFFFVNMPLQLINNGGVMLLDFADTP